MTKTKSKPLGRGLNTLLGSSTDTLTTDSLLDSVLGTPAIGTLPLAQIRPNKDQPRKDFDEERLEELAESIRTLGLVQPITVEPLGDGTYQIIAGERRWRAAQRAGLQEIPVYIRTTNASERRELTLIENIQRQDLNAIEVALAYQEILESQELTQEELARRIGKKRSSIANYLRLLRLPAEIQLGLTQRLIDMGHARALLQVEDSERQMELYQLIRTEHLSVRAVEELARAISETPQTEDNTDVPPPKGKRIERAEFAMLEEQLTHLFASKVTLRSSASGKGKLTIPFANDKELEHILLLLERLQH
ncbi:MAG: ParB/RepB/Spo0J family partition protein [Porphyromonadaceae bacterium]|nr:ParB/RepB/Spo0J family partition protein [Porphyromonadaceae bacterium]